LRRKSFKRLVDDNRKPAPCDAENASSGLLGADLPRMLVDRAFEKE
jgi:hypothetical protein